MEFTDVQNYINENKESEEVKGLIKSFQQPLNRNTVEAWCKDGEGKSWLARNCDIYSNKAVETARTNAITKYESETLPQKIKEAIESEKNKGKTPADIEMEKMKKEIETMKAEKAENERIRQNAIKLKEKGLDEGLAKYIKADEDVDFFEKLINNAVNDKVKEKLGESAYKPPISSSGTTLTKEQFDKMTYNEKLKLFKENKDLYDKLK